MVDLRTTRHQSTREIVVLAMLIALTVAIARILIIPVSFTHGNINFCDTGIFIAALVLGRRQGLYVGALSGFLLDLISGYAQYMIFSLIVHGLEGYVAGWLGHDKGHAQKVVALVVAAVVMVVGYFVTDTLLYGAAAGIAGIATNAIQGAVTMIAAVVIALPLENRLPHVLGE
ncbi:ECF transporter S component [Secundilactobacillus kimchicus]